MKLVALPAFADNYIWMLHDGRHAAVVDPGEAAPVHAALDAMNLGLVAILVTHHHADHVGGVDDLRARLEGPVYGPRRERIPEPCVRVGGGDAIHVLGLDFDVLDVPGHTAGHIAYAQRLRPQADHQAAEAGLLFCGDTLFSAGCGRLFEGTPAQMLASLDALNALPGSTRVCCTHEYTVANLRFAAAVEPDNPAIAEHQRACAALCSRNQPTLPSTLQRERQINPFLRCRVPEVVASARSAGAGDDGAVAVLAALREWKNRF